MARWLVRILALVATAGLLVGCGAAADRLTEEALEKGAEEIAERGGAGDVDVELDDEGLSVEGEDGSLNAGSELPEDWAEDLPLPDQDYEILSAMSQTQEDGTSQQAHMTLDGDAKELQAFYEAALADAGWEVSSSHSTSSGERTSLGVVGNKPDDRKVIVTINTEGDGPVSLRIAMIDRA